VVTNGKLLPGIDQRSAWVRRVKDLLAAHIADLSEAEYALARRAVTLIVNTRSLNAGFIRMRYCQKLLLRRGDLGLAVLLHSEGGVGGLHG
jgi:hypothetical protein